MKRLMRLFSRHEYHEHPESIPGRTAGASSRWVSGDMPARAGCRVRPLIDGREAMHAMCVAFLRAERYILLAGWDIQANLLMVRGEDVRAGEDGSPGQEHLIE